MTTRDLERWRETDFGAIGAGSSHAPQRPPARSPGAGAWRARRLRALRLLAGCVLVITLLTLAAIDHQGETPAPARLELRAEAPTLRTPPALWKPRPESDLVLAGLPEILADRFGPATGEAGAAGLRHRAERHSAGGLRDHLSIGAFDLEGERNPPYLHLVVTRDAPEASRRGFYVAMALHAAEEGLAIRRVRTEAGLATTRLSLTTAGMQLEDGRARDCIAFRGDIGATTTLAGWYCAAQHDPESLACIIDGLEIVSRETGASLFADGESAPGESACGAPGSDAGQAGIGGRITGERTIGEPTAAGDIASLLAALENEDGPAPSAASEAGPLPPPAGAQ